MDKQGGNFQRIILSILVICVIVLSIMITRSICTSGSCASQDSISSHNVELIPGSCTTFAASLGNDVLFGNNEDFNNPITYLWTIPSKEDTYGGVYLGYKPGRPQGGINEKGLAFDALALPAAKLNPHSELPSKGISDTDFLRKILGHCATVEEAIAYAQNFNWGSSVSFQVLLADASGDAVIISAGANKELAFTRKSDGDGYLLGTNFNLANPENHSGESPFRRYEKADEMLTKIQKEADLNVDYFRDILDAVHVEGIDSNTLYSNIIDLPNGVIYLYYWHQFDEVVSLNVAEQIEMGLSSVRLSDLFSQETVNQADQEYQKHQNQASRDEWLKKNGKIIIAGGGAFILGILGLIVFIWRRRIQNV